MILSQKAGFNSNFKKSLVLFGIVEIIPVKKLGQRNSCAFAKALYGYDFRAFSSYLEDLINVRG